MYIGTEIEKKIKEKTLLMKGNVIKFEVDDMKFLIVRDGTSEAKEKVSGGAISLVPPQNVNNEKFLIFNE